MTTSIRELSEMADEDKMLRCIERTEDRVVTLGRPDLGLKCLWVSVFYETALNQQEAYWAINPVCVELAAIVH